MQTEPKQYKNDDLFEGELTGRRLLQIRGSKSSGTKYRFSDNVDIFWLALESDTPEQIIWISPKWKYRGPNTGFFELGVEALVLEAGQLPTLPIGSTAFIPPWWQALIGLFLSQIHSKTAYDERHVAALTLSFKPTLSDSNSALLEFDSSDLDDPFFMLIKDDKLIGRWALREDVQGFLNIPRRAWDTPWNTPVYPWDFTQHFEALSKVRQELQGFMLWLTTEAGLQYPKVHHAIPIELLWTALHELSVFEIALAHKLHWVEKDNSWLDRDGEDYGPAWVSLGLPYETEKTLASSLRVTNLSWQHLMKRDVWPRMIDANNLQLNFRSKADQITWKEDVLARIASLEKSFEAWKSWFFQCISRVTTNE
jgi:hypothetical protein